MKMLHIRCCCCVLFICGNGSPLVQVTITTRFSFWPNEEETTFELCKQTIQLILGPHYECDKGLQWQLCSVCMVWNAKDETLQRWPHGDRLQNQKTNKQTNKNICKNIKIMFKFAWDTPTFDNNIKIMVSNKSLTISLVESRRSISWFSVLTSLSSKWGLDVHQLIHVHVSVLASHYWNPSSLVADKRNYFPKKRNWRSSMESSPPQSTAHCNRILWGIDGINKGPLTLWPCHLH